eukprot:sb/3477799/
MTMNWDKLNFVISLYLGHLDSPVSKYFNHFPFLECVICIYFDHISSKPDVVHRNLVPWSEINRELKYGVKVRFKRLDLRFLEIGVLRVVFTKRDPQFPGISGQVV